MKLTKQYEITYDEFVCLYRIHSHVKFHLRRYMILATLLFFLGESFERFLNMDFASINSMVLVILIISIVLNLVADFILPKQAFQNLKMIHQDRGVITITDDELIFGEGRQKLSKKWTIYTNCIETETAFLLYQKDQFTILLKDVCGTYVDEVRKLIQEKVNKGKVIKFRK